MLQMPRDLQVRMPARTLVAAFCGCTFLMPLWGFGDEPSTTGEADTPLALSAETSSDSPRMQDVNDGSFFVRVRLENTSDHDVVVWPYFSAKLVDADENEVPTALRISRWGRRRGDKDSLLEEMEFVTLAAGEKHEFDVRINRCVCDALFITGWQLSQPGGYRLVLHSVFDREKVKETFGKGCRVLHDAAQDWNRALEIDAQVDVPFTVNSGD